MKNHVVEFFDELNNAVCPRYVRKELRRRGINTLEKQTSKQGQMPPDIQVSVTVDQKGNILP